MLPKKKSTADYIVYGICFVIVLYLSAHGAIVWETVNALIETGEIESSQQILTFINLLSERISVYPFSFYVNQYTQDWLLYGGFGCFIVLLAFENGKRNYIHGKEFGTAKWGTRADISDLFAANLEREEIKKAKQVTTKLGRWKLRTNAYEQCEKDGKAILKQELEKLKSQRPPDKKKDKAAYEDWLVNQKAQEEDIRKKVADDVVKAKVAAWEPDRLKAKYEEDINAIDASPLYSEEWKATRKNELKSEYEEALENFFNVNKRILKIKEKYKDADMILTATERISIYNYKLNNNTLIIGGSGSGKTRGYVMPNILQAHSSYIVTDPKGEILEKAGDFLTKRGYKVRVLNLDEKTQSDSYNPFVYIHPKREGYEERVLALIETIIVNTDGGEAKNSSDPFWDKAERLFLQSIFFFTSVGFVPEQQNMNTVLDLIEMLQIEEERDSMNSDLDVFVATFATIFGEDHIGVKQYREFRSKASGKTAKSVVITAVARLAPFRTSAVKTIFNNDNMHLELVGEEKTAVFVIVPPTDNTFNFIAGMLFTQLFQELQYCATQVHKHHGQRLPVPCRFILDEFANTCKIPNFVRILAYARSFGIGITVVLQSLDQIKHMYEKEWGVIVDNCNTLLYLGGVTHVETLEYMSKLLGKGTFDKRTTGRTRGRQGSSSTNEDVVGRELMDTAEIRKLPKNNCLLIVGGRNPFYSEKYDYPSHPNYRYTSDGNNAYSFKHQPKQKYEESPHGEETVSLVPSENAVIEVVNIGVDENKTDQLYRITKNISGIAPIPDEDMVVDDGENGDKILGERILSDMLAAEEIAKQKDRLTVSTETITYLEELKKNKICIEENLLHTANRIGRMFRTLEPIPDKDMVVDDGEKSVDVVNEKYAEYILEEDSLSEEELRDILEDDPESIAEMLEYIHQTTDGVSDLD